MKSRKLYLYVMLAILFMSSPGCSSTEVLIAAYSPNMLETDGFCRVAQDEIRVMVEGTDKIGILKGASSYFVVPENDLVVFVRALKKLDEIEKKK